MNNRNIRGLGTMKRNYLKQVGLPGDSEFKRKDRGFFVTKKTNDTLYIRWKDTCVVTFASNDPKLIGDSNTTTQCSRYSKKERKRVATPQPILAKIYNSTMACVDIFDAVNTTYQIKIESRKWYFSMVIHLLQTMITAAYKVYDIVNPKEISHLDFTLKAIRFLCSQQPTPMNTLSNRHIIYSDHYLHALLKNEDSKLRCKNKSCFSKSKTPYYCRRCNVHLHVDCFLKYHDDNVEKIKKINNRTSKKLLQKNKNSKLYIV